MQRNYRFRPRAVAAQGTPTPFNPAVYGLDAIDSKYALHGVARLVTSYTGSLARLRRSSDNVEADFGYDLTTGFLSTADIQTWLAGATAFVVTLYDQTGNSRPATNPGGFGTQPALNLSGAFPVVVFDRTRPDTLPITNASAVYQNISVGSLIGVWAYNSPQSTTFDPMAAVLPSGVGARVTARQSTTTDQILARRTDAAGLDGPAGFAADFLWHVRQASFDWGAATARYDRDSSSSIDATFQTPGSTPNTASAAVAYNTGSQYANFSMSMGLWRQNIITGAEFTSLATSLAPLKQ